MVFRRFRVQILCRSALLTASLLLLCYLVVATSLLATTILIALAVGYQVAGLIRTVEKTNRDLSRFLLSVSQSDFSQTSGSGLEGASFDELRAAFSEVLRRFREIRLEREENFQYLQAVFEHVGTGMLAYRDDGEVELINAAAKRLFAVPSLKRIDDLERICPTLVSQLRVIRPGQRDLITAVCNREPLQLSVHAAELRLRQSRIVIVSLQNISRELNAKEMEAWQNLIRVLTHEIKNSLTPISSLASTLEGLLVTQGDSSPLTAEEDLQDARNALRTIRKRSQGLLRFVDATSGLTHLPRPSFEVLPATELLDRIEQLILPEAEKRGIDYSRSVQPESLKLSADAQLIEQVMINILLNAMDAVEGHPGGRIDVMARLDERGRVSIEVVDNGPGITQEAMANLFVPFFTTKRGGSGIGLSLSRQILRLHHGDLTVQSVPGSRTAFTLRF